METNTSIFPDSYNSYNKNTLERRDSNGNWLSPSENINKFFTGNMVFNLSCFFLAPKRKGRKFVTEPTVVNSSKDWSGKVLSIVVKEEESE